ncbi:YDR319C-like protein [Saccharomyces cerevisiae FostersO]|nr:YDR319C-like protein [Saccharomyces cerevisiae FostersO]
MDILPLPISSTETSSSYLTYTNHWPLLKNRIISIMITQYACKFVLKYLLLFLNFQFIDHVFIWTGGECSSGSKTTSAEKCRLENGKWDGGFDISGHFCFLVSISMILWMELHLFSRFVQAEDMFWVVNKWVRACLAIVCDCPSNLDMYSLGYRYLLSYYLGKSVRLPYGFHMPCFHIPHSTQNWDTTQLLISMINREN